MSEEKKEFNANREWTFETDLSGLQAPTGLGDMYVPEGYYKAIITDMYVNTEKNTKRVVIKLQIAEGQFRGVIRTDGMNIPESAEDPVRYYWRAFAESVGFTTAELDKGKVKLSPGTFKGKIVHTRLTPKDRSANGYERVTYLAPAEWTQQSQTFIPVDETPASASASASATTTTSSATTTKDAVKKALGL